MADVKVYDRLGEKILVPEEKVGELVKLGGRVATEQELKAAEVDAAYEKKSTFEKATSLASMAGPLPFAARLLATGEAPSLPPGLESYAQGVGETFTAGVAPLAVKEAVSYVGGEKAGKAYAQNALDAKTAYPTERGLGQAAGVVGGIIAGGPKGGMGRLSPMSALGLAGDVVETGVRGVATRAGIAEAGVLGRAAASGAALGARGGVEAALLSAANQYTEDKLADREVTADKIYAAVGHGLLSGAILGGGLGVAGSLGASALRGAAGTAKNLLGKLSPSAVDAEAGAANAPTATKLLPESTSATVSAPAKAAAREAEAGFTPGRAVERTREAANDLAFDALGTTRKVSDQINKDVKGGTRAVGDFVNRRILKLADEDASLWETLKSGRADELLPRIVEEKNTIGRAIGDEVKAYNVKVTAEELMGSAQRIWKEMETDPTRIRGADAFRQQIEDTGRAFRNANKLVDGQMDLSEMYYARAQMEKVAHEMKRGNNAAGDAMKEWLREVDSLLVNKMEQAAKSAGETGARERIMGLKREYQLASAAEKAATDGTNRVRGNNIFGIREGIGAAAGMALGNPIAGIATAVGGKVLRERGAAAGAFLLTKAADAGVISRIVQEMNALTSNAARGVLMDASKGVQKRESTVYRTSAKAEARTTQEKASAIVRYVSEARAAPHKLMAETENVTKTLASAPETAALYNRKALMALQLVASKIPQREKRDPLSPSRDVRLTQQEAATLVRTWEYAELPKRVFADFARGKVTKEGVEVAKILLDKQFPQFQDELVSLVADKLARKQKVPYATRLKIEKLLGIPADATLRPETLRHLQANLNQESAPPDAPPAPANKPVNIQIQQSGFDQVEARRAG